jgi:hypothetical protein
MPTERKAGSVICFRCRSVRQKGDVCPVCRPVEGEAFSGAARGTERSDPVESVRWHDLRPVFEAPHEIAAISVQAVLEEEEIPAVVRSAHLPAYAGVTMTHASSWGWVLVPKEAEARAKTIVESYLLSLGVDPPDSEGLTDG